MFNRSETTTTMDTYNIGDYDHNTVEALAKFFHDSDNTKYIFWSNGDLLVYYTHVPVKRRSLLHKLSKVLDNQTIRELYLDDCHDYTYPTIKARLDSYIIISQSYGFLDERDVILLTGLPNSVSGTLYLHQATDLEVPILVRVEIPSSINNSGGESTKISDIYLRVLEAPVLSKTDNERLALEDDLQITLYSIQPNHAVFDDIPERYGIAASLNKYFPRGWIFINNHTQLAVIHMIEEVTPSATDVTFEISRYVTEKTIINTVQIDYVDFLNSFLDWQSIEDFQTKVFSGGELCTPQELYKITALKHIPKEDTDRLVLWPKLDFDTLLSYPFSVKLSRPGVKEDVICSVEFIVPSREDKKTAEGVKNEDNMYDIQLETE